MAIDVKNIQVWAQRVVAFSVAYVKKNPIHISVLSFLFLLYIFLRSLFIFLVFSIPIFIFIGFTFRLIFHIHKENLRTAKGENYNHARKLTPSRGGRNLDKRGNSYGHAQSVRRRSSKKYENHVHFQEDPYEKDALFSILDKDNNDLVDKTSMVEETPKEIREVEFSDGSGLRPIRYTGERLGLEGESSDDREEEDEPEDGNKAVEWTEDDQKNLMDLGVSEMERNKRLESLIAKRKARKLLSLQVRRTLMNIGKGEPFLIPKIGNLPRSKSAEALISPTPGSAPSVLLPVHNPFDIPYDPQEEKPNLTGGFQEGLVENHYNDAVFCRHESFSLGPISQGPWDLDHTLAESSNRSNFCIRPKTREIPEFSRFKEQIDKDYPSELKETETSQESETMPCVNGSNEPIQQCEASEKALDLNDVHSCDGTSKVENDSKLDTNDIHDPISSYSSDVKASYSTGNKNETLNPLSFSVRKNIPVAELDTNFRRDEFIYHENSSPYDYKGMYAHTPSMSIASDLQVEVSEASSQITNLSSDGGSPKYDFCDDVDVEKEGSSKNEEVWVASPPMKRVEENEARSGEVREVSEQDIMEVGLSRINQDTKESITLQNSQSHSSNYVDKVHEEVEQQNNTYISENLASTKESESELFNQNHLEIPKEPFNSVEKISTDEKTVYDMNDQVELVHDDQGIIKFIQHTYGEDPILKNRGTSQDISTSALNDDTKPVDISEDSYTQPEKNNKTYVESLVEKHSEPEHVAEGLNIIGNNNTQVGDILAENGLSKTSSSTSPRYTPEDKETSITGMNDSEITISSKKDQSEQVGTAKTLVRPIKRVMLRGIKPRLKSEGTDEQVTSTPSSTRKKFYLMANMSFDDIYEECQQFDVENELNGNMPEDLKADQTQVGVSVGLQESSSSLSRSTEDRAVNEGSRSIVEKMTDDVADTGSQASTEETIKTETIEGVEKIGEIEKSEDVESDAKVDNTTDNSETVVDEKISENLTAFEANNDPETVVAPILNNDTKPLDVTQGNCTVPESNNSNYVESLKGEVERQHEAENVTETLDFTGDSNRIVREPVDENGPTEASSATSSRSATVDKNPSIFLEKPKPISVIPKAAFEQVTVASSPSSTRKKFYLMANMKFDDIYEDGNPPEDSTAEQTHAGDSVGLKDSNESMGGGLGHADEKLADVSSQTPMEETEKTETGIEEISELERSENVQALSNFDNTLDNSKSVGVIESHSANLVASDANNDPDIRVAP